MRKMKFLTIAAAMFAVSTMLTSCWSDDEPVDSPVKVSDLIAEDLTIVASSNAEAVFSIDATATAEQNADKLGAKFTDVKANTVKVTAKLLNATGYVTSTQTATVHFSKTNTNISVAFDFAKKSTDTAAQADVAASTSDVTVASNLSEEVDASMTIPAGTLITSGSSTESFSVTAYEKPADIVADMKVGETISDDVIALDCTPDGCKFSKDIKLTVFAGKSLAGKTLTIDNNGEKVTSTVQEDGNVTFPVPHFSNWRLMLNARIKNISTRAISLMKVNFNVKAGKNVFSFIKNIGASSDADPLLQAFVRNKIGGKSDAVEESGSFESNQEGEVILELMQNVTDYELECQGVSFKASRYEDVKAVVTTEKGQHSGGGIK